MKLVTGNDLAGGAVIWWAGDQRWSLHLADAVDAGENADAVLAQEAEARRVNAGYVIDAEASAGGPMPLHIKERIRAAGPTVRADLAINPAIAIVKG